MLWTELDHIVLVAPSLDTGAALVRRVLGVEAAVGGAHVRMATHNRLLRLGERCYLEIIAVDPSAPPPTRPRWFGMDRMLGREDAGPMTWVARTNDIDAAVSACRDSPGEILRMSRGAFNWCITVPADGDLLDDGAMPTLIQWDTDAHPAPGLPDVGVRLRQLVLHHPDPERCEGMLLALRFKGGVRVERATPGMPAQVEAFFDTPGGIKALRLTPS